MARKRDFLRAAKNKDVFRDGVNQRASIKQMLVAETISGAAPCDVQIIQPSLCKKNLVFDKLDYVDVLKLSYYSKNNLFSRIFDLIAQTTFQSTMQGGRKHEKDIRIGIAFEGRLKIKSASFFCRQGDANIEGLISRLNDLDLIKERILSLEVTDVKINYDHRAQSWTLGLATGKGSTLWNLFPPLMMLVNFSKQDAIHLLELFQLMTHEIMKWERHEPAETRS